MSKNPIILLNAFHRREHGGNSDFRVAIGGAIIVRRRLVWQKFDRIWRRSIIANRTLSR